MNNTITQAHIDSIVAQSERQVSKTGKKTCVVTLISPSGFEITETSACVDPDNYDQKMGEEICLKRIVNKLWELEGYLLQSAIANK